jgi:hypothetical protein
MFEIGKKVRCIKGNVLSGVEYTKGIDYSLYGLKNPCCALTLDIGLVISNDGLYICQDCNANFFWSSGGPYWVDASHFVPLDEITEIEVIEETVKIDKTIKKPELV